MGFLAPLMKEEKIRTFISDLPKSMSLASSIVEALVQPEMISVFEAGIPLNEILKEIDFQKMVTGDTGHSLPSSSSFSSSPSSLSSGRSSSGVTVTREEVPKIVQGIKEASKVAAPHLKILVHNFSSILNLEEDLNQLDLTGNGTDLLACEKHSSSFALHLNSFPSSILSSSFSLSFFFLSLRVFLTRTILLNSNIYSFSSFF